MGDAKRRQEKIAEQMAATDKLYASPSERATLVWTCLQRGMIEQTGETLDAMSTMMFCSEYIGQMSLAIANPEFTTIAKALAGWIYNAHYTHPEILHGEGDRARWDALLSQLEQDKSNGLQHRGDGGPQGPTDS